MRMILQPCSSPVAWLWMLFALVPAHASEPATPQQVVETMHQDLLEALAAQGNGKEARPEYYYSLARRVLKPNFDVEQAARTILGPAWKTASDADRRAFQQAFEDYLVTSYATALRHVTAKTFKVTGEPRPAGPADVILPVRVVLVDGDVIDAELRMRRGPAGWQIWDAGASGTTMVKIYRGDIGTEAAAHGIPQTVRSLNESAAGNRARDRDEAQRRADTAPKP